MAKPHPGSVEARALGCTCPPYDAREHAIGLGIANCDEPADGWYVSRDCWLHKSLEPVTVKLAGEEGGSHA